MSDLKSRFLSQVSSKLVKVDGAEGFYARELTAGERDRWEKSIEQADPRTRTIIACLCDADGNAVFTKNDHKDVAEIPCSLADRVLEAFKEANSISEEEAESIEGN